MMTSRRVGLSDAMPRDNMGKILLAGRGEKSTHKRGDLFPSSRRVGSRVPPVPTSLRLVEMAPPLSAEVLRSRSGGLFKVMPPNGQRFFAEVMPFAAGGSPISLGSLCRSAVFRPGSASWTCFHASQIMMAHNVRGDIPSGLAFPGPGLVTPALVARPVRAWVARSCKSSSARVKRSGSTIGPWDEASRNSRTQRTPGLRSQRTRLLRPQARSFSFALGRAGFPRQAIAVQPPVPAPKLLGQPRRWIVSANKPRDVDEGVQVIGAQVVVHPILPVLRPPLSDNHGSGKVCPRFARRFNNAKREYL